MALKALTTIKHGEGDKTTTFNTGDEVKGLNKETVEGLQAAGAVGSEQDLAALSPEAGAEEITRLQARIAELEAQQGQQEVSATGSDPLSLAAKEAAAKESSGNKGQK